MTPTEITTAARDIYNATGDTFFTDLQLYNWMQQGCQEFAKKAWLIEQLYTTSTVASQQSYTLPTLTIGVKRITVNGKKIKHITNREDDAITLSNQAVTSSGQPIYYYEYNYSIYLRPIPDAVYTMIIFSFDDSAAITATSTLTIPALFHFDLVDYLLWRMFAKDKDVTNMTAHLQIWKQHVVDAIAYKRRLKRTDSFATVQSEDTLPVTILGEA